MFVDESTSDQVKSMMHEKINDEYEKHNHLMSNRVMGVLSVSYPFFTVLLKVTIV
jgi:hypothetical protein